MKDNAIQTLFHNNLGLAYFFAKKVYRQYNQLILECELEQIALIALWNSAKKFNPDLGYKFTTYASKAIIHDLVREAKRHLRRQAIFPSMAKDDYNKLFCKTNIDINEYLPNTLTKKQRHFVFGKLSGLTHKELVMDYKSVQSVFKKIRNANK